MIGSDQGVIGMDSETLITNGSLYISAFRKVIRVIGVIRVLLWFLRVEIFFSKRFAFPII